MLYLLVPVVDPAIDASNTPSTRFAGRFVHDGRVVVKSGNYLVPVWTLAVTVIFFFDIYRRKIKSAMLWTWSEEVCHALRIFSTVLDVTDTCTTVENMTDSTGKQSWRQLFWSQYNYDFQCTFYILR